MKKTKINLKTVLMNLFLVFFCFSIILDLHVFYNSLSTLIRALFISILFGIIIVKESNKKERKLFILYAVLLLAYIFGHHINALHFKSFLPDNLNYSLINELLYFYKMITNIFLFYIIYKLNIRYLNLQRCIKIIVLFMSLSIIVSDVLAISYTAYNFDNTSIPFYKWFTLEKYDFRYGSSKGFFDMSNQIVALFLLYLPVITSEAYQRKKISNYILEALIILAMLLIGNRLAVYGTIIELLVLSIIYFIISFKQKKNYVFYIINTIFIISIFIIIPFSPLKMRQIYYDAIYNNKDLSFMQKMEETQDQNIYRSELENKLIEKKVDPKFYLNSYPYEYDLEFWNDISTKNVELTGNARYMEQAMIKRLKEVNNNNLDNLFGLTYVRVMNVFNIEKDYIMQFYSVGIFGCIIFLGFYFVAVMYSSIKILFDIHNKFNVQNVSMLFGVVFVLLSAYFSGNILNSINMIMAITAILSVLINEVRVKKNRENKERILGFDVSLDSKEDIVNKCMNLKTPAFIVNVNPLIVLDHYKSMEKRNVFNEQLIQIPDGEGVVLVSKLRGGNINKRIAGIDLMLALCEASNKDKRRIYLYGAKEGVAKKAKKELEKKYPGINIVGTSSGYGDQSKVLEDIKKTKAEILFVALGSPLQEDFIIKNMKHISSVKVWMPVGGSFDVISGNISRAPKIIQSLKLEWLYRMVKEPKRLKGVFKLGKFVILSIFEKNV